MKRSQALRNILRVLKKWDNCKIEKRMAEEVLSCCEFMGMSPPWYIPPKQKYTDPEDELGQWSSFNEIQDWEPEKGEPTEFDELINELYGKKKASNTTNRRRTTKSSK